MSDPVRPKGIVDVVISGRNLSGLRLSTSMWCRRCTSRRGGRASRRPTGGLPKHRPGWVRIEGTHVFDPKVDRLQQPLVSSDGAFGAAPRWFLGAPWRSSTADAPADTSKRAELTAARRERTTAQRKLANAVTTGNRLRHAAATLV